MDRTVWDGDPEDDLSDDTPIDPTSYDHTSGHPGSPFPQTGGRASGHTSGHGADNRGPKRKR